MSTVKPLKHIDLLEILARHNWGEGDDLEFKSARGGLPSAAGQGRVFKRVRIPSRKE